MLPILPGKLFFTNAIVLVFFFFNLNFMTPFYGWGSTAARLKPLRGGSLLFTF